MIFTDKIQIDKFQIPGNADSLGFGIWVLEFKYEFI